MEQLPVNMIERIEVVRGGGSSLAVRVPLVEP
jgi:outer membrane cobalamin receptor